MYIDLKKLFGKKEEKKALEVFLLFLPKSQKLPVHILWQFINKIWFLGT